MRAQPMYKQALLFVVFWLWAGALSPQQNPVPASSAPLANATIADFKDNVQVQLPGQSFSTPSLGQTLPAESEINTDNGQMLLRLEDGSEVLVHPHTHLVLKQPTPSNWQRVQLLLGRIKAEITKRVNGAPQFQIGTPSAVISVRGTRFYVDVDQQKTTEVDVEEGVVQLENVRGIGTPVLIQAGSSSRVGENSAPEPVQPTSQLQQQSGKSNSADNSDSGGNGKSDGNSNANGNGKGGQNSDGNSKSNGNAQGNSNANGNANGQANSGQDSQGNSNAQGNANAGSQGGQNSGGNSNLGSHASGSSAGGHSNASVHGNASNAGSHGNSGAVHTLPAGAKGHGH